MISFTLPVLLLQAFNPPLQKVLFGAVIQPSVCKDAHDRGALLFPAVCKGSTYPTNFSSAKQTDYIITKGTHVREQLQGDCVKRYIPFTVKVGLLPPKTCIGEAKPALFRGSKLCPICLLSFPYTLLVFSYSL